MDSRLEISGMTACDDSSVNSRERVAKFDLYYYRARYYDPMTGRFMSRDPLGLAAGDVNLYRYVGNNPVSLRDPFGLFVDPTGVSIYFTEIVVEQYANLLIAEYVIAPEVLREAERNFPANTLHNGIGDAWRHARWSSRMANELGWLTAVIAGYGHEIDNLYEQWGAGEDIQWDEFWMDLHNNRVGRSRNYDSDLLNEELLRTIDPPCSGTGGLY